MTDMPWAGTKPSTSHAGSDCASKSSKPSRPNVSAAGPAPLAEGPAAASYSGAAVGDAGGCAAHSSHNARAAWS
jgi:hypothetical protein